MLAYQRASCSPLDFSILTYKIMANIFLFLYLYLPFSKHCRTISPWIWYNVNKRPSQLFFTFNLRNVGKITWLAVWPLEQHFKYYSRTTSTSIGIVRPSTKTKSGWFLLGNYLSWNYIKAFPKPVAKNPVACMKLSDQASRQGSTGGTCCRRAVFYCSCLSPNLSPIGRGLVFGWRTAWDSCEYECLVLSCVSSVNFSTIIFLPP